MYLKKIHIQHFRNIESAELEFGDDFNYIVGQNGAGKTSLLEAISVIARGKSFKTSNTNALIQEGKAFFLVVGTGDHKESLGIRRTRSEFQVRLNGQPLNRLTDLARLIPLFVITPSTHELIERGPDQRRQFMDWGLFHVEPHYARQMQAYRKALKQRNAALRGHTVAANYWDKGLAEYADNVDRYRSRFLEHLAPLFVDTVSHFEKIDGLTLNYHPGWNREKGLLTHLQEKLASDKKSGNTSVGPHRADLLFRINGEVAKERLSRGQQKLVVTSFVLAQARLLARQGLKPTILIDDLPSELDQVHQATLLTLLDSIPSQKLVTSIDNTICQFGTHPRMFHVEHGSIRPE